MLRIMQKLFLIFFLSIALLLVSCVPQQEAPEVQEAAGPSELDGFAKCVYETGARMYGQYTCGVCKKQRELFGPSFQYIQEIECHPRGENPQTQRCLERDIEKTPTWILEKNGIESDRLTGFQTLELLSEFSGCPLEQ